jgi:WD40 repeat protein
MQLPAEIILRLRLIRQSRRWRAGAVIRPAGAGRPLTVELMHTGLVGEPLTGHAFPVYSVAFGTRPGGWPLLASGSKDATVRLWGPATGSCVATIHRRSSVHSVAMTGETLAIGDDEGAIVIKLNG